MKLDIYKLNNSLITAKLPATLQIYREARNHALIDIHIS